MENIKQTRINFNLEKGGLVCEGCSAGTLQKLHLSKGTIKQLIWIESGNLARAVRISFTSQALKEGLEFLEAFVPYHLGKEPRSLTFLREIRG